MNVERANQSQQPTRPPGDRLQPQPPRLDAEALFAGTREVRLIFRNEEYRLRITRNRKLILTK